MKTGNKILDITERKSFILLFCELMISSAAGQQVDLQTDLLVFPYGGEPEDLCFQIGVGNYVPPSATLLERPHATEILVRWHIEGTNDPARNDFDVIELTPAGTNKVLAITGKRQTLVTKKQMWPATTENARFPNENVYYDSSANPNPDENSFMFSGYDFMSGLWRIGDVPSNEIYYLKIYLKMGEGYESYRIVVDDLEVLDPSNNEIIHPQHDIESQWEVIKPVPPSKCVWDSAYNGWVPKNCFSCCGVLCGQYTGTETVTLCECPGGKAGSGKCYVPCLAKCTPDGYEIPI